MGIWLGLTLAQPKSDLQPPMYPPLPGLNPPPVASPKQAWQQPQPPASLSSGQQFREKPNPDTAFSLARSPAPASADVQPRVTSRPKGITFFLQQEEQSKEMPGHGEKHRAGQGAEAKRKAPRKTLLVKAGCIGGKTKCFLPTPGTLLVSSSRQGGCGVRGTTSMG